jgi:hypothetical protein
MKANFPNDFKNSQLGEIASAVLKINLYFDKFLIV